MANRANAHDAVPGFEVTPGIPSDGGDAVAELDAVAFEALRHFQGAIADRNIIGAMNRPFD